VPLYRIRRNVGPISQEEMDASAFRALICAQQFPGLKWHRSYWDRAAGFVDCFYEAADAVQIEEHARTARIPCDEVRVVDELVPATYLGG
jgi:hypothetical protein